MSTNLLERTVIGRSTWSPKLACALTLGLVFLVGATAGAILMDLRLNNRRPDFDTPAGKIAYFERMQKELDLTPAQSEQIQSVLNDFWQYYRTVLSDSKARVEQTLTDTQRRKFELLLQEQQHQ